jgi:hypothetical protein
MVRLGGLIHKSASPLEGEVDSAKRWRVGGMEPPSPDDPTSGNSTPHPSMLSIADLPLKGGGAYSCPRGDTR